MVVVNGTRALMFEYVTVVVFAVVANPFNVPYIPLTAFIVVVPVVDDASTVFIALVDVKYSFLYAVVALAADVDVGLYIDTFVL